MKTIVRESLSYKIEMELTADEAQALMGLLQNPHMEDEPGIVSHVRTHIFQALGKMGVTP